jgi:hypothetical protein
MVTDAVKEKIRKVQTLADRATDDGEAQAAVLAMQRLLARHGLTDGELTAICEDGTISEKVEIIDFSLETFGRLVEWKGELAAILADNFRCMVIWQTFLRQDRRARRLRIVGASDDVELCRESYYFTVDAIERLAKEYAKAYPGDGRAIRTSYVLGFLGGLRTKLKKQVESIPGMDLVITRNDKVDEFYTESYPNIQKMKRATKYVDPNAYEHGKQDGSSFKLRSNRKVGTGNGNGRQIGS